MCHFGANITLDSFLKRSIVIVKDLSGFYAELFSVFILTGLKLKNKDGRKEIRR